MLIAGAAPYFLNSYLSDDRAQFRATLTNADLGERQAEMAAAQLDQGGPRMGSRRRRTLPSVDASAITCAAVEIEIDFFYGVDFADVFEVRGLRRARRGQMLAPSVDGNRVELRYRGLDNPRVRPNFCLTALHAGSKRSARCSCSGSSRAKTASSNAGSRLAGIAIILRARE